MKNSHRTKARKRIEKLLRQVLIEIGENPYREGLVDTPARMADMYEELFSAYKMNSELDVTLTEAAETVIATRCQRTELDEQLKSTLKISHLGRPSCYLHLFIL